MVDRHLVEMSGFTLMLKKEDFQSKLKNKIKKATYRYMVEQIIRTIIYPNIKFLKNILRQCILLLKQIFTATYRYMVELICFL